MGNNEWRSKPCSGFPDWYHFTLEAIACNSAAINQVYSEAKVAALKSISEGRDAFNQVVNMVAKDLEDIGEFFHLAPNQQEAMYQAFLNDARVELGYTPRESHTPVEDDAPIEDVFQPEFELVLS